MNIAMLTMEKYDHRTPNSVGSSRIRGRWVMKYCPELQEFINGMPYDAVILQKAYWLDFVEKYKGIKIFDVCDPDWLDRPNFFQIVNQCDAITVPTIALKEYLEKISTVPVHVIPDRLDLTEHYPTKLKHQSKIRTAVWFGYSQNYKLLEKLIVPLHAKGIQLVVIGDKNYPEADIWIKYDYQTINYELIKHDIAVLPSDAENVKFRFKSNNKQLTSWALGIPVVTEYEDLTRLETQEAREVEAHEKMELVKKVYDVKASGAEYLDIINKIAGQRRSHVQV